MGQFSVEKPALEGQFSVEINIRDLAAKAGHSVAADYAASLEALAEIAEHVGVSPATLYRYLPAARTAHGSQS